MGRLAFIVFTFALIACGSHADSGAPRVDALLALEQDPRAALAAAKHPTYKATYELSYGSLLASPSASPGVSVSSTQTYVARPPDFRWDFALSGAVNLRMTAILRGQDAVVCTDAEPPPACYSMPVTYTQQMLDSMNMSPLDSMQAATKDMDATVLPRERIAGLDAACFSWRPRVTGSASPTPSGYLGLLGDAKLEACFSADGIMLRSLISAGALFSVEQRATSVSSSVTDADLALPYPLSTAPFPIATSAPLTPQTPRPTPTH